MALGLGLPDRYHVLEKIGQGAEGNVYRARDRAEDCLVAIKLPREVDQSSYEWFRREVDTTSAIRHENVVRFLGGDASGMEYSPYLVTELIEGDTLYHRLNLYGPMPAREAAGIAAQIAAGLDAVHRAGFVHRDIKPDNVMIRRSDGAVKLLDFGISVPENTRGRILGTPTYMPPEMAQAYRDLYAQEKTALAPPGRPQADLYSLGLVIHEMVHAPVFGPDSTWKDEAEPQVPRLSERGEGVPAKLDQLVASLTARNPGDRPASAGDVARQLSEIAGSETRIPAYLPPPRAPGADVTQTVTPQTEATPALPKATTAPLTGLKPAASIPSAAATAPPVPASSPRLGISAETSSRSYGSYGRDGHERSL